MTVSKVKLSKKDWNIILESLNYSKYKFENYEKYPSYDYKQQRVNDVLEVILKVKEFRNQ